MDKKIKRIIYALVLIVAFIMPVAIVAMNQASIMVLPTQAMPYKGFTNSANCAIDTTNSKVTNLDDTDNMYGGGYKTYTVVANTSLGTASARLITSIVVEFVRTSTCYFSFTFTASTKAVAETTDPTYMRLISYANKTTASTQNVTINFKVEYAMPSTDNVDLNVTAVNAVNSTESTIDTNYDFITTLTAEPTIFFSVHSAKAGATMSILDTTFVFTGFTEHPKSNETDFYLTRTPDTELTDSWSDASYSASTGVATWAAVVTATTIRTEKFTITAYAVGTTATDVMYTDLVDYVTVENSGVGTIPGESGYGIFGLGANMDPIIIGALLISAFLLYKARTMPKSKKYSRRYRR
jgi:hypothetical protein